MAANVRFLNPTTMAKPPGYSYVVETTGPGRTVYIAGQLGLDMDNKLLGTPGDFRSQCTGAFENLAKALAAVGATFADVVKINNYLVDMSHIGIFREVRDSFLNVAAPPASTTVAISQLARPGALFEIEAIAVLPAKAARSNRPKSKSVKSKSAAARRAGAAKAKAKAAKRKRR
jgi:enamine deaminase RidA (YjgF/YER057c/UK114 family)